MDLSHRNHDLLAAHLSELNFCARQWGQHDPRTLAAAHQLAVVYWGSGEPDQAIGLLDQALDGCASALGREDPLRIEILGTLAQILFEQRHLPEADAAQREVLEFRTRYSGANHPHSIEAKSDLAAILYELGQNEEACALEVDAFESARAHLGRAHRVTSVLAWNRALNLERGGDLDSAQRLIAGDLAWLLAEDPAALHADQREVRTMLAAQLRWNAATAC